MTTFATVHDEERRAFWLEVLGSDTLPIVSPIGRYVNLPGKPNSYTYKLDVDQLEEADQVKLVKMLAAKFGLDEMRAWNEVAENGVPVLAEDVTVTCDDIGLLLSMMDGYEDDGI